MQYLQSVEDQHPRSDAKSGQERSIAEGKSLPPIVGTAGERAGREQLDRLRGTKEVGVLGARGLVAHAGELGDDRWAEFAVEQHVTALGIAPARRLHGGRAGAALA